MSVSVRPSVRPDKPLHDFEGDVPLAAVMRGGYVNNVHRGVIVVVDAQGHERFTAGDAGQPVFMRSSAKPFQVMPAVLAGAVERFGLSDRELAVLCASHHAEARHTETVLGVLQKAGLDEGALQCGVHPPIDPEAARRRVIEGREPTPVCNNCSGAHTGMLLACLARGWPLDGYGDPRHPLQQETLRVLAAFAGVRPEAVEYGTDNCAVPAFRLPVRNAATAFARLAAGSDVSPELSAAAVHVVRAMTSHPEMVGGEQSFDTALMRAARGALVSKGGADGFQGIGSPGEGSGLALKISDGNSRAIPPVVIPVLERLQLLSASALEALVAIRSAEVRNHQGALVGSIVSLVGSARRG